MTSQRATSLSEGNDVTGVCGARGSMDADVLRNYSHSARDVRKITSRDLRRGQVIMPRRIIVCRAWSVAGSYRRLRAWSLLTIYVIFTVFIMRRHLFTREIFYLNIMLYYALYYIIFYFIIRTHCAIISAIYHARWCCA